MLSFDITIKVLSVNTMVARGSGRRFFPFRTVHLQFRGKASRIKPKFLSKPSETLCDLVPVHASSLIISIFPSLQSCEPLVAPHLSQALYKLGIGLAPYNRKSWLNQVEVLFLSCNKKSRGGKPRACNGGSSIPAETPTPSIIPHPQCVGCEPRDHLLLVTRRLFCS